MLILPPRQAKIGAIWEIVAIEAADMEIVKEETTEPQATGGQVRRRRLVTMAGIMTAEEVMTETVEEVLDL